MPLQEGTNADHRAQTLPGQGAQESRRGEGGNVLDLTQSGDRAILTINRH